MDQADKADMNLFEWRADCLGDALSRAVADVIQEVCEGHDDGQPLQALNHMLRKNPELVNRVIRNRWTPLGLAAMHGHLTLIELLLDMGAAINDGGPRKPPLHWACENRRTQAVLNLLGRGADIHARDARDGNTALHAAASGGSVVCVEMILELGADIHALNRHGKSPLRSAAGPGHAEAARFLIERGARLDWRDGETDESLLHWPAGFGRIEILALLVKHGVNISAPDAKGQTPLHRACDGFEACAAEWLINHGADIHAVDNNGATPLHLAAYWSDLNLVQLLIERGADREANDIHGETPLHCAISGRNTSVAAWLIENGADIHAAAHDGATPLHVAAHHGEFEIERLLVEHGANREARDIHGATPADYAEPKDDTPQEIKNLMKPDIREIPQVTWD